MKTSKYGTVVQKCKTFNYELDLIDHRYIHFNFDKIKECSKGFTKHGFFKFMKLECESIGYVLHEDNFVKMLKEKEIKIGD